MYNSENDKRKRTKADYSTKYFVRYIYNRLNKKYGLSYSDISSILSLYHELAREDLALGEAFYFKKYLGTLQVLKEKREVRIDENGNLVNDLLINFPETWKLWKEKPELKNKTYVRFINKHSDGFFFKLKYSSGRAKYKYKNVYKFKFNSTLKEKLHKNIMQNKVDAYINKY